MKLRKYDIMGVSLVVLLCFVVVPTTNASTGNSMDNPQIAVLGNNNGSLSQTNNTHWFKFNSNASDVYTFTLTANVSTDFNFAVYSSDGNLLHENFQNYYPKNVELAGRYSYYIEVYIDTKEGGNFTLNISHSDTSPGVNPNVPIALELGLNNLTSGQTFLIFNTTKNKYYTLDIISKNSIGIYFDSYDRYFYLRDDEETTIFSNGEVFYADYYVTESFKINISETESPNGSTPDTAVQMEINSTQTIEIGGEFHDFVNFTTSQLKPVEITLNSTSGDNIYFEYDVYFLTNDSVEQIDSDFRIPNKYYIENLNVGNHSLFIRTGNTGLQNITLTITQIDYIPGYNISEPIVLNKNSTKGEIHSWMSIYYSFSTSDTYYYVAIDSLRTETNIYIEIYDDQEYLGSAGSHGDSGVAVHGSGQNISIIVWSDVYTEFILTIEDVGNITGGSQEDAIGVSVGDNFVEISDPRFSYWLEFDSNGGYYQFRFPSDFNVNLDFRFNNGQSLFAEEITYGQDFTDYIIFLPDTQIYIVVDSFGSNSQEININIETTLPPPTIYGFSDELLAGDIFEWEVDAFRDGEEVISRFDPFAHGNNIELEIENSSPLIEADGYEINSFSIFTESFTVRVNGEVNWNRGIFLFVIPTSIGYENYPSSSGEEAMSQYLQQEFESGLDYNIENDEIIFTKAYSDEFYEESYSIKFDLNSGVLLSYEYHTQNLQTNEEDSYDLTITLMSSNIVSLNSRINSGSSSSNGALFELPLPTFGILSALITIPVIRRKHSQA